MAKGSVKYISAGDLEKFSYCPLSWWLSAEFEGETEELADGIKGHEELGKSLWRIESGEKAAKSAEWLVFWWAIIATIIAIIGLELLPIENAFTISQILSVVALIWILAASYFLFRASRPKMEGKTVEYEKIILSFAIVATVIAANAVAFLYTDVNLAIALEIVAIAWLVGASYFLYRTLRTTTVVEGLRKEFRVSGKIEYIDMAKAKVFVSEKYGLSGRPDYIIKVEERLIPVEEKVGRTPRGPLFSHILQAAAYCLLIEDSTGQVPPYALLKYPEAEHEIDYNEDLKKILLAQLAEMRKTIEAGEAHRNHNRPGKCKHCSRRDICPEKLA